MRRASVVLAAGLALLLVIPQAALPAAAAASPTTVRLTSAPPWGFAGSYLTLLWEVKLNSTTHTSDITDAALYFDTRSHAADGQVYWLYPTKVSGATSDGRNFTATFRAPVTAGKLYFTVMANVSGTTIYNATEGALDVLARPVVRLTTPGLIPAGEIGAVRLDIDWAGGLSVGLASVHYDWVSHAQALNASSYPNATVPQGGAARSYNFTIAAPAVEGDLYMIGRARIGGVDFYTDSEYRVAVSTGPRIKNLAVATPTGLALAGQSVGLSFDVEFNAGGHGVSAVFRFGTTSHAAEGLNASLYPGASTSTTASPGTRFSVVFMAPAQAGTAYGVITILVGSRTYVASQEIAIQVLARPTISVESVSDPVNAAQPIVVVWRIQFSGDAALISETSLHWDTTSHSGAASPSADLYPNAAGNFAGNETNVFTASIPPLGGEGKIYFTVRARVNGMDLYLPQEASVDVGKAPSGLLPGMEAWMIVATLALAGSGVAQRRRA